MAYQFSRKGCFKCGNCKFFLRHLCVISNVAPVGHIAENCSSEQRLCYNCRQPGHESSACPSPRTVAAKQCYSCGGVGHIQAECPNLRVQSGNQKCYVRFQLVRSAVARSTVEPCLIRIAVGLDTLLAFVRVGLLECQGPGLLPVHLPRDVL
ncbi:hypothetical protein EDD22DRAFT_118492 [Suillus occidentalis]|nr:hypothetical protein EDD22DRAFT_118492 [Suillus occidentalis]